MAPFTDVRVRQAFRLIVDRPAMLEQVLSGLRPRRQRPLLAVRPVPTLARCRSASRTSSKAKSLLKAAGHDDLTIDLHTTRRRRRHGRRRPSLRRSRRRTPASPSTSRTTPTTTATSTKWPFSVDFWGTRNYLPQVANGHAADRAVQRDPLAAEVAGSNFARLYKQALPRSGRRPSARHHPRDAGAGVRQRRLHHPVLQQPGRRLLQQGGGLRAEQGRRSTSTRSATATGRSGSPEP